MNFLCVNCGAEFSAFPAAHRRFCTMACSELWRAAHPHRVKVDPAVPAAVLEIQLPVPVPPDVPLTPEELARLAVYVLCGKIIDVRKAVDALEATPWPEEH